jgi:hypothetical protein
MWSIDDDIPVTMHLGNIVAAIRTKQHYLEEHPARLHPAFSLQQNVELNC